MSLTTTPESEMGLAAPDFRLPGTDGQQYSLDTVRGPHGLLLMFICNHCPYVQAIRKRLVADCRDLLAAGIGVAAINSNDAEAYPEDSFACMVDMARDWDLPFPYLHDVSQQVARAYGAVCTPDFFGYDNELLLRYRGRLDAAHVGEREPGMPRELVEAMLEVARSGHAGITQVPSMGCSIKWKD